jgi:GNAT superfamily N-acetyltransferase
VLHTMRMTDLVFRPATAADVADIVALIVDDQLGAERDIASVPVGEEYVAAFRAIDADPNQLLIVAVAGQEVVGTAQLTFLPGLARRGAWRMQIEAVRVAASRRGQGLGREMLQWCIQVARDRGCALVQLTSDARRTDAQRFYGSLGFVDSHIGFKLALERPP